MTSPYAPSLASSSLRPRSDGHARAQLPSLDVSFASAIGDDTQILLDDLLITYSLLETERYNALALEQVGELRRKKAQLEERMIDLQERIALEKKMRHAAQSVQSSMIHISPQPRHKSVHMAEAMQRTDEATLQLLQVSNARHDIQQQLLAHHIAVLRDHLPTQHAPRPSASTSQLADALGLTRLSPSPSRFPHTPSTPMRLPSWTERLRAHTPSDNMGWGSPSPASGASVGDTTDLSHLLDEVEQLEQRRRRLTVQLTSNNERQTALRHRLSRLCEENLEVAERLAQRDLDGAHMPGPSTLIPGEEHERIVQALETERARAMDELQAAQTERTRAMDELQAAQAQSAEHATTLEKLRTEHASALEQLRAGHAAALEQLRTRQESERNASESQLRSLQAEHASLNAAHEALQQQAAAHEQALEASEARYREALEASDAQLREALEASDARHREALEASEVRHRESLGALEASHRQALVASESGHREALAALEAEHASLRVREAELNEQLLHIRHSSEMELAQQREAHTNELREQDEAHQAALAEAQATETPAPEAQPAASAETPVTRSPLLKTNWSRRPVGPESSPREAAPGTLSQRLQRMFSTDKPPSPVDGVPAAPAGAESDLTAALQQLRGQLDAERKQKDMVAHRLEEVMMLYRSAVSQPAAPDVPGVQEPPMEAPVASQQDVTITQEPPVEAPAADSRQDVTVTQEPLVEAPAAPSQDVPIVQEPPMDAPAAPSQDVPIVQEPPMEVPVASQPDVPIVREPPMEAPVASQPDVPVVREPPLEALATEAPPSEAPVEGPSSDTLSPDSNEVPHTPLGPPTPPEVPMTPHRMERPELYVDVAETPTHARAARAWGGSRFRFLEMEVDRHRRAAEQARAAFEQLRVRAASEREASERERQLVDTWRAEWRALCARLEQQHHFCMRVLGKADGREEMDGLLDQIKASSVPRRAEAREETGEDAAQLLSQVEEHIGDMAEGLARAGASGLGGNVIAQLEDRIEELETQLAQRDAASSADVSSASMADAPLDLCLYALVLVGALLPEGDALLHSMSLPLDAVRQLFAPPAPAADAADALDVLRRVPALDAVCAMAQASGSAAHRATGRAFAERVMQAVSRMAADAHRQVPALVTDVMGRLASTLDTSEMVADRALVLEESVRTSTYASHPPTPQPDALDVPPI
ncbi:Uncharacterized protein MSYG_3586 [Malassezia sympodialis ATCC 42132]|uniref:Up-regulated during septation protein 1 domain-containing protein n=1 Tax=Malassezia sympodialis (strain ATCC 42132) TaxID=1230383 RepID=A0A1M8AA85_MALS4|nr:Uncharacterized protein MSYG_3586 [Malassezia sympodialis ATCC 42132]